jgi:RNA-directed DNA polymerase
MPVRFADHLVVTCWFRSQAEKALARLKELLARLGLEPKVAKTCIVSRGGRRGTDFPGFITGWRARGA